MRRITSNLGVGLLFAVAAVLPSGCMVGPDPTPPTMILPDSWHAELVEGMEREAGAPTAWWDGFGDPFLAELIAIAESRNLDLRIAESRIRESRALYGIAAADLFPTATTTGDAYFNDGSRTSAGTVSSPSEYYTATLDLAWEVDVWGRVRRGVQAAEFTVAEAVENRRDALVTIRAEVARSYLEARSYQGQAASLARDLASRLETLRLVEARYRVGAATDLDVAQAAAQAEATGSQLPVLEASAADAINRLSVLLGEAAGPLRDRMVVSFDEARPVPQPLEAIAVGIPADTIRRRPDVRSSERALMAAVARIGVAEASLFPALRITGSGGFSSADFQTWFTRDQLGGLLGIELSWPIFTAGRLESAIDVRNEQAQQALLAYERTVLEAIAEVESSLVALAMTVDSRRRLEETVRSYETATRLARQRYEAGVDDLQVLLTNERGVFEARQQLALIEGQVASNAVGLYKALGGAWEIDAAGNQTAREEQADDSVEMQG